MKSNKATKTLNIVLMIGIVITLLLMVGLPFILGAFIKVSELNVNDDKMFYAMLIFAYLIWIPYILSLFKLRTLTKLILKREAFTEKAVNSLKLISIFAFSECIIFIIGSNLLKHGFVEFKDLLLIAPLTVIAFITITIGLLFAVLATLFRNAMEIKEENDMTI